MKTNTTSEALRKFLKAIQNQKVNDIKECMTKDLKVCKSMLMAEVYINSIRHELYLPIELYRVGTEIKITHNFGVWMHGSTPIQEGSDREDFRTVDFYKKIIEAYTKGILRMLLETKGIKIQDYIPDELALVQLKREGYMPGEYKNYRVLMREARKIAYESGFYTTCDDDDRIIDYYIEGNLSLRLIAVAGKGNPDGCQYRCVVVEL